jgi:hypothetical protein
VYVCVFFFAGVNTSMIQELAVVRWDGGTELEESFRRRVV